MRNTATNELRSDAFLQSTHGESLHNGPGWLCLYNLYLAEHFALPCFGGWLHPCLDPAKAWDGEEARFLHFSCRNFCQGVEKLCALRFFYFSPCCQCICQRTFGHGLGGGLHCWSHVLKYSDVGVRS